MHFLAGSLKFFAEVLEFLLQFENPGVAVIERVWSGPALSFPGGVATSVKTIITIPRSASGSSIAWTVISTVCVPPPGPDLETLDGDRLFLPDRLLEGASQIKTEPFTGHGENIPVGLAGRRLKIFARPPADIEDITLVVDQHGRRRKVLQEQLVRERLEIGNRVSTSLPPWNSRQGGYK